MLTDAERRFLQAHRVARFATSDARAQPHVLPVCYGMIDDNAYFSIDAKPKLADIMALKRLRNIRDNPRVALVVDHYEHDWERLGWVMLQGRAEILESGDEHGEAQAMLRTRYPQLRSMAIEALPVVVMRIARALSWGNLDARPEATD